MPQRAKGPRLYQRKDTEIWIIRDTGRGDRSTGTRDRSEAEKQLAVYLAEKDRRPGGPASPEEMTIAEALLTYATEHAPHVVDPARIGFAIDALTRWWGEKPVSAITRETCRAYGRGRTKAAKRDPVTKEIIEWEPCAIGTVRKELGVLAAAVKYCTDEGRLLWAAYRAPESKHIAKFILLALYTGTRKSAILGLRFAPHPSGGHIDTQMGLMYRRSITQTETKKKAPPATLPPGLLAHLKRWERAGSRFVVAYDGQGVSSIKTAWRKVAHRAGLEDVTPHTLRHTAITWACQTGRADMWELGGYFGVSPETMNNVYAHHHPDYQQNAVAALGGRKL